MKTNPATRLKGFTLIELLTVITVIGILVALLFPMIKKGLVMAQHTGCISNMRAIAGGMSAYAYDNDGKLPAPGWGSGADNWLTANNKMLLPEDVKTGLIWPYMGTIKVYRCPADSPPNPGVYAAIEGVQNNNCYKLSSFCMNGSVIGFGNNNRTGYKPTITGRKRNTLHIDLFSGEDIMFWEADETRIRAGMWWDASNFPHEGMSGRHIKWGSVAMIDGSAEKLSREDYYNNEAPGNIGRTRLWNVPSQFSGNGH